MGFLGTILLSFLKSGGAAIMQWIMAKKAASDASKVEVLKAHVQYTKNVRATEAKIEKAQKKLDKKHEDIKTTGQMLDFLKEFNKGAGK